MELPTPIEADWITLALIKVDIWIITRINNRVCKGYCSLVRCGDPGLSIRNNTREEIFLSLPVLIPASNSELSLQKGIQRIFTDAVRVADLFGFQFA